MSPNVKLFLAGLIAVIVAVVLSVVVIHPKTTTNLGDSSTVEAYPSAWTNGIQIGSLAPVTNNIFAGSCAPTIVGATSIAATSSVAFQCSISNVPAGATAYVSITNPGTNTFGELEATGGSTTAGKLNFYIYNGTGVATSSAPQATSSVKYLIIN